MSLPGALGALDLEGTGALREALSARAAIFEMTAEAENAVVAPKEAGGFSHGLRAALAVRMARTAEASALVERYTARMDGPAFAALADPAHDGAGTEHAALIAFLDKVSSTPKDIEARDIQTLKAAGYGDADIVRLCELIAFIAYQVRVAAGMKLLSETPA